MARGKPSKREGPSGPGSNRQGVLSGRVTKSTNNGNKNKAYPKLSAAAGSRASPGSRRAASHSPATTSPGVKLMKYGPCPKCPGRRIRSRFNPHGNSPHKGKFRFVCSNRYNNVRDCDYQEVLESDPLNDPEFHQAQAEARVRAQSSSPRGGGGGELFRTGTGIANPFPAAAPNMYENTNTAMTMTMTPTPAGGAGDNPTPRYGCPECLRGRLVQKVRETAQWRERVLVCEKVWNAKEGEMVGGCGYKLELENGPAYDADEEEEEQQQQQQEDGEDKQHGYGYGAGVGGALMARSGKKKMQEKKKEKDEAEKRREVEEWEREAREWQLKNPFTAAILPGPADDKDKIVVDLTSDDELLPQHSSSARLPASSMIVGEVGGSAPIYISDDDEPEDGGMAVSVSATATVDTVEVSAGTATAEFDDLGSDEEMELVKMADQVDQAINDDLGEEEELELLELADQVSSSMTSQ
ncbi:uncharacterized protein B0T15DRAFT_571398 [Chaetomium strumarium]|uniref:Uncharacterized protein n=1 Tax=Chaetomium strumarium TaxID=1170767 RepID=A0AAJ0H345_9PEZI|nr:hypothetical protein B0T15DRAFT_571398 [Chaetomium strumarium]